MLHDCLISKRSILFQILYQNKNFYATVLHHSKQQCIYNKRKRVERKKGVKENIVFYLLTFVYIKSLIYLNMLSDYCKQLILNFSAKLKLHHYLYRKERSSFWVRRKKVLNCNGRIFHIYLNRKREWIEFIVRKKKRGIGGYVLFPT